MTMVIESAQTNRPQPLVDDRFLSFFNLRTRTVWVILEHIIRDLRGILSKIFPSWQILDLTSRATFPWKKFGFWPQTTRRSRRQKCKSSVDPDGAALCSVLWGRVISSGRSFPLWSLCFIYFDSSVYLSSLSVKVTSIWCSFFFRKADLQSCRSVKHFPHMLPMAIISALAA